MSLLSETHYAKYILDREGAFIIESDLGFLTYKVCGKECWILDTFVIKGARNSGVFGEFFEQLKKTAFKYGCSHIFGNIYLLDVNHATTLAAAMALGFKVIAADGGRITIAFELGGE